MRETRQSGSEGGGAEEALPTPIQQSGSYLLPSNRYRSLIWHFVPDAPKRICVPNTDTGYLHQGCR